MSVSELPAVLEPTGGGSSDVALMCIEHGPMSF